MNTLNIISFEERKLIDTVISSDIPEELKKQKFQESFQKLTDMNIKSVASSIESITTELGESVKDTNYIIEFLGNCDRKLYDEIKIKISSLIDKGKLQPIELQCEECTKTYSNQLNFDQSNFFE